MLSRLCPKKIYVYMYTIFQSFNVKIHEFSKFSSVFCEPKFNPLDDIYSFLSNLIHVNLYILKF